MKARDLDQCRVGILLIYNDGGALLLPGRGEYGYSRALGKDGLEVHTDSGDPPAFIFSDSQFNEEKVVTGPMNQLDYIYMIDTGIKSP